MVRLLFNAIQTEILHFQLKFPQTYYVLDIPMSNFASKSPIPTSKYGLLSDNFSKVNSKFCGNDKKSSRV